MSRNGGRRLLGQLGLIGLVTTLAPAPSAALPASVEVVRRDEPILVEPAAAAKRRGAALRGARLPVYGYRAGPGCDGGFYLVGPLAWICAEGARPSRAPAAPPPMQQPVGGLPHRYHFVRADGSFGYRDLGTAESGVPDAQFLPGFGVALTAVEPRPYDGDPFGLTTHGLWIPMRDLGSAVAPPDSLAIEIGSGGDVWVIADRPAVYASPGASRRSDSKLERLARVRVQERRERGREVWLRIGEEAWLRERDTTSPRLAAPPPEARPDERWLDVDLERQIVTAYRGERAEFAVLASTGRGPKGSELATPTGTYRIWVKLRSSDMDNLENLEARTMYSIQAVPWVMYFHRGYGLHGAFWHRAFGRVQSHGCVNLPPVDAQRFFDWTSPRLPSGWSAVFPTDYEPGTLVRVR